MLNTNQNLDRAIKEIEYAYEKTPFYKEYLESSGVTLSTLRHFKDITGVPPTSKIHYRKNFPLKVLSHGFTMQDERLYRTQSSGTASERLITMEVGLFYMKRAMETLSVYPEVAAAFSATPRRHIRYAAPNCSDVECANPNSTMADRLLKDGTLVLSVYHDLLTTTEKILENNVRELSLFKPSMYYIDSTHLAFLSRYMKTRGYRPPVAPILSSYTIPTQISKRQVKELFGAATPYAEFVSMSELGWLALECAQGQLHINNKSYYIELIAQGKPVEPGELGELYVTTLDNGCTPKLRYKTGDIYKLVSSHCTCGHSFPTVEFHGRLSDFIIRDNTILLTPKSLDQLVMNPPWLTMYRFEQHDEKNYELSLITNNEYITRAEDDLVDRLRLKLGPDISLQVVQTHYIPTERSGKFLSCVSSLTKEKINSGFQI
ncbi:MAG: hypothetical protein ACOYXT_30455 [Bacteroidota bacterium]